MELKWLEDFAALAETRSFSRAAETRHVTQSALSRRIKQLETWLGATLVNRATVPAELTPAGQSFLPVANDAIRMFHASREALQPTTARGMVRFACLHTLTVTFFPNWLQALNTRASNLRTSLIPDRGGIEANLAALIDGEADFFLTYAHPDVPFHLDGERFELLAVGNDRLVPVSAPTLRINGRVVPATGVLDGVTGSHHPIPYLSYGFSSFFGVALQRMLATRPDFPRRTTHENPISAGLKTLALSGAGLCWLPESLVRRELEDGRLAPASTTDEWTLDLQIYLYRALANHNPATDRFWSVAEALARDSVCEHTPAAI